VEACHCTVHCHSQFVSPVYSMTSLHPRSPYSPEELRQLYPEGLQLQLVQILLRHGERSPVSARFQNAGLNGFWPYCSVARQMISTTMEARDSKWSSLQWRRRLETFGSDDGAEIASGPRGQVDGICNLGELTDKGRETTYLLGTRLRNLYVDQLKFMPSTIQDADMIYMRATPSMSLGSSHSRHFLMNTDRDILIHSS